MLELATITTNTPVIPFSTNTHQKKWVLTCACTMKCFTVRVVTAQLPFRRVHMTKDTESIFLVRVSVNFSVMGLCHQKKSFVRNLHASRFKGFSQKDWMKITKPSLR